MYDILFVQFICHEKSKSGFKETYWAWYVFIFYETFLLYIENICFVFGP